MARATTARIDLSALRANLQHAHRTWPSRRILPVLKADAFGHGLECVADALAQAHGLGVDSAIQVQQLRAMHAHKPLVALPELFDVDAGIARYEGWLCLGGPLYGLGEVDGSDCALHGFRPALSLQTRLIAINWIEAGGTIGYSGTWRCPEDMPVGVAAVGFGDGYPRSAPCGTPVLVNDGRVPLIGRVSMDLITLDLRSAPDARVGDAVTLWGPALPANEIAAACGTLGTQLACAITPRVLRVWSIDR